MDELQAKRILLELKRRKDNKIEWFTPNFEAQNNFINDPAQLKAAQCSRRSGKSYAAGIYLLKEAYETPGVSVLYIALTRDSAKKIMCKDVIEPLNRQHNLGLDHNKAELSYTLPNGSVLYLVGADANPTDMDKLLGQKYKIIVVDEAAMFRQDMHKLVYEILMPAVADYEGTICLISTTSDITQSLYYDVSMGKEPGWSVHKWTAADNPFMREKWLKEIAKIRQRNPNVDELPRFKRMYLNQWYVDTDALVYKFNPLKHTVKSLPNHKDWKYVLGVDLGWDDATAFTVCAFVEHDPTLYIIETYKKSQMYISPKDGEVETDDNISLSSKIKQLEGKYGGFVAVVIDHNKQIVEELRSRHGLELTNAQKTDKRGHIELFNADLISGKTKLLDDATKDLQKEYSNLIWCPRKLQLGKHEEYSGVPNHLCFVDGTLVDTPHGKKPIETLKVGDMVISEKGVNPITFKFRRKAKTVKLLLNNGEEIITTPDHPFKVGNKWIKAENVKYKPLTTLNISFLQVRNIIKEIIKVKFNTFIGRFGLTILTLPVWFVIKFLNLININKEKPVVINVMSSTEEYVNNITVANEHNYFAEGVLVSNCDASLYAWRYCYNYAWEPLHEKPHHDDEGWIDECIRQEEKMLGIREGLDEFEADWYDSEINNEEF